MAFLETLTIITRFVNDHKPISPSQAVIRPEKLSDAQLVAAARRATNSVESVILENEVANRKNFSSDEGWLEIKHKS